MYISSWVLGSYHMRQPHVCVRVRASCHVSVAFSTQPKTPSKTKPTSAAECRKMPSKSTPTYFHQPSKNKNSFTVKQNKTYFRSQKITASSQQAVVGANYMETDKPPLRNAIWKLTMVVPPYGGVVSLGVQ